MGYVPGIWETAAEAYAKVHGMDLVNGSGWENHSVILFRHGTADNFGYGMGPTREKACKEVLKDATERRGVPVEALLLETAAYGGDA